MSAKTKKKSSAKKWILLAIFLFVIGWFLYAFIFTPQATRYNEETAKTMDITTYYSFSGNIEAKKETVVHSTENDQIRKIHVQQGDAVRENDVILTAESGKKYKANMNGTVTSILLDEKDSYLSGTELYRIVDFSVPQVSIKIDEYDISALTVGMPVEVYVHPLEKTIEGTVSEISLEATVTDNISFYKAIVDVHADEALRIGMSCEATLVKDSVANATALSIETIQYDENRAPFVYMYAKNKNEVLKQPVSLGITDGTWVQIINGIVSGDTIVTPQKNLYMMPMERMGR
ncbi:MAG: HlyD family efflux transporter periplasmic adaptor subunit [Clostridiales bacterium]|nr:HlyD family efflux transporter periplasmic adaptor subunit [Clostridiales bacterium]